MTHALEIKQETKTDFDTLTVDELNNNLEIWLNVSKSKKSSAIKKFILAAGLMIGASFSENKTLTMVCASLSGLSAGFAIAASEKKKSALNHAKQYDVMIYMKTNGCRDVAFEETPELAETARFVSKKYDY
jgi:hypothetical protein